MTTLRAIATLLIALAAWLRRRPIDLANEAVDTVKQAEAKADKSGDTTDLDSV